MGGGQCSDNAFNCADTPNPLPATETLWIERMTWMDVRDALAAGKTTAIISTGGMEPNGPWLVTGKHNYVLHANCEAIARDLGNALCAPIVKWVPEGQIAPQSGHMRSPGTISLRQETFEALLTDVAGVLDKQGGLLTDLTPADIRRLRDDGTISGGMIPKLETCVQAVESGCEAAVVLDGRVPHAMLLEFFTARGAGTLVAKGR